MRDVDSEAQQIVRPCTLQGLHQRCITTYRQSSGGQLSTRFTIALVLLGFNSEVATFLPCPSSFSPLPRVPPPSAASLPSPPSQESLWALSNVAAGLPWHKQAVARSEAYPAAIHILKAAAFDVKKEAAFVLGGWQGQCGPARPCI